MAARPATGEASRSAASRCYPLRLPVVPAFCQNSSSVPNANEGWLTEQDFTMGTKLGT